MTHYKIEFEVLRAAGMHHDACFHAFCGVDLRTCDAGQDFVFLPQDSGGRGMMVDCPTCKAIYETISQDAAIDRVGP